MDATNDIYEIAAVTKGLKLFSLPIADDGEKP